MLYFMVMLFNIYVTVIEIYVTVRATSSIDGPTNLFPKHL